ncbi:hypothetical protein DFQ26_001334, partial [Actinomortierella ambigua]
PRSSTVVVKRISLVADLKSPTPSAAPCIDSFNRSLVHQCSIDNARHYHQYHSRSSSRSSSASSSRASSVNGDHPSHSRPRHVIYRTSDVPRARHELPAPVQHQHKRHDHRYVSSTSGAEGPLPPSSSSSSLSEKSLSSTGKTVKLVRRIRQIFSR